MENTGFKGLLITLWQRVILSYKTTLLGIGIAAVGIVIEHFAQSPNKVIATAAIVAGSILALVKEKLPPPPVALPEVK
jgi:hypothetical protein